jgi:hypothetical protein
VKLWREREIERERQRTVKLNPNTPSHAIQNTVAKGNTFKTQNAGIFYLM